MYTNDINLVWIYVELLSMLQYIFCGPQTVIKLYWELIIHTKAVRKNIVLMLYNHCLENLLSLSYEC